MISYEKLAKYFAIGIPNRKDYGNLNKLKPNELYDFIVQHHETKNPHYDIRFGNKNTGLFSWVTRKGLPESGRPIGLFQQPVHAHSYKDFEGDITSGYGKGRVSKLRDEKILVTKATPDAIHFSMASSQTPERYALIRPKKNNSTDWLIAKAKALEKVDANKLKFKLLEKDKALKLLNNLPEGSSVQPKIDGALNFIKLLKNRAEILSYRTSKRTGGPIVHTERFFQGIPNIDIPKEYVGSILLSEIYGDQKGKSIQGQELGGLLNSGIAKSIGRQKERGIKLKAQVFDIAKLKDKIIPEGHSYAEKKRMINNILKHLPKDKFHMPDEVADSETSLSLLRKITEGNHPLTREGIVIRTPDGKRYKFKSTDEHDVYIREFVPGEGKYTDKGIGAFRYSWTPTGDIVGKVGTGLSDESRKDMFDHPDRYIGEIARVRAHERYPSGALRAPAFLSMHYG